MRRSTCLFLLCVVAGTLFQGLEAATFKNPQLIATAYDPMGLASTDLNGDGHLDLVYVDGSNPQSVHVLLGHGNATFTHVQDLNLPLGICGFLNCVINMADVNADGQTDLILGGGGTSTAQISVLPGIGDGTFRAAIVTVFQPQANVFPFLAQTIGVGYINGDGAVDLVVPDASNGQIYLLFGDNSGSFAFSSTILTFTRSSLYLKDVNGDGHLDVVSMDPLGARFAVLPGNGNGTFQAAVFYNTGAPTGGLFLTDLDGDGPADVVAIIYPGQIVFLRGNPNGTFTAPSVVTNAPYINHIFATVADANDDGLKDLLFLTPSGLGVMLGQGNLTYGLLIPTLSGKSNNAAIALGDLNEDGRTDVAMGVSGGIALLDGLGGGAFASGDLYDMGQLVGAPAVADFNRDGFADIAVTLPATFPRLLLGLGGGAFNLGPDQNPSYGLQGSNEDLAAADFNGDGNADLVVFERSSAFPFGASLVLFGDGNGTFSAPLVLPDGPGAIGDLNNDGRSDMIVTPGLSLSTLLGQPNGTFTTVTTPLRNSTSSRTVALGDLNNDGKLDVLIYGYVRPEVWLGSGDGSFAFLGSAPNVSEQPLPVGDGVITDLDGDGNADFVLAFAPNSLPGNPVSPLSILYGNGDGTFQSPAMLAVSHRYWHVAIADVNQDNKPDLVVDDGTGIAVIVNLGGRVFGPEDRYVAGQGITSLSTKDVSGDGFPDIVVANPNGTTVAILLNEPNGTPLGSPSRGVFSISPEPSEYSQPITLSLVISSLTPGLLVPTGSVTFSVDGSFVGSAPLNAGTAVFTLGTLLRPGAHTLIAAYNGDATFQPASFAAQHFVQPPVFATQTVLIAEPTTAFTSQTVRLTATIISSPPVPAGIVTFLVGTSTLGAGMVGPSGIALFDTALLAEGTHTITAVFQGFTIRSLDRWEVYAPSVSAPVTVIVNSNPTATALAASTANPTAGSLVTFTATVSSGAGTPFGGVTFFDGGTLLGTTSLRADGTTTFSTASLSTGPHVITARFNPNATFAGSASAAVAISVVAASPNATPTVVSLSLVRDPANDDSKLSARVVGWEGSPAGVVTFLDRGEILGTAQTDEAGASTLHIGTTGSGVYRFSASYSGNSHFAPAVSPELQEQWPAIGPGFSLSVQGVVLVLEASGSKPVAIRVQPDVGFQQQVQLSCEGALPDGYQCVFSPARLNGGGTSILVLRPIPEPRGFMTIKITYPWTAAAVLASLCILFMSGWHRRRGFGAILPLVFLGISLMGGCGHQEAPAQNPRSQVSVLTIRATSGTDPTQIIHASQIVLRTAP